MIIKDMFRLEWNLFALFEKLMIRRKKNGKLTLILHSPRFFTNSKYFRLGILEKELLFQIMERIDGD